MPENKDDYQHPPRSGDWVLTQIERRLERIEVSLGTLTALEYDHRNTKDALVRVFQDLKTHSDRINIIEQQAPVAELIRKWVIGIIWIAIAGVAGAVISLVVPSMRGGVSSPSDRGH